MIHSINHFTNTNELCSVCTVVTHSGKHKVTSDKSLRSFVFTLNVSVS